MRLETTLFQTLDGIQPAPSPPGNSGEPLLLFQPPRATAIAGITQQLIDDLPEQIALLDETGAILSANRAWRQVTEEHGYFDAMPGYNYRSFCADKAAKGYEPAVEAVAALDDLASGRRTFWQLTYNGGQDWNQRDYQICFHRIIEGGRTFILVTRFDLTEISELRRDRDDVTRSQVEDQASGAGSIEPETPAFLQQLIDGFTEEVAIVDENWIILATNEPWRSAAETSGYDQLQPGRDYRSFLTDFGAKGYDSARAARDGISAISEGKADSFQLTYDGQDQWTGRTLQLRINRLHINARTYATIERQDVSASQDLVRLREEFCSSVIKSQAMERQRMARELHDSASQLLTGVGLLLCRLKQQAPVGETVALVDELQGLVKEAQQEIRVVSYLSLPPALEKQNFVDALQSVIEGFGRRTRLDTSFEILGEAVAISKAAETALYRCAQEALSNAHRHARATRVGVLLCFRDAATHLVITDDGVGISHEALAGTGLAGVGLASMRSRLSEIGGRLSINRLWPGTAIIASVNNRVNA
jgi:signal transduction histidine kinase